MPHRAVAIANEFLNMPGATEIVTQMQLQKLAYISHGWNLGLNNSSLIIDDVEAWAYGPVYRDLYDHTKYFGKDPIGRPITPDDSSPIAVITYTDDMRQAPFKATLTERERELLGYVWERYGDLSAFQLSQLTHQPGTPWYKTYYELGRDAIIPNNLIREHYRELVRRAKETATGVAAGQTTAGAVGAAAG